MAPREEVTAYVPENLHKAISSPNYLHQMIILQTRKGQTNARTQLTGKEIFVF